MSPPFARSIDTDWLRRRLTERPGGMLPGDTGWLPVAEPVEALKPAAVLVPLLQHEHGVTVLLTRRTDHLHDHAGQISFPGGRVEPGDDTPMTTALRETEEEIGLARNHVEIIGCLQDYRTGTGYQITPVVGLLRPPLALRPDDFEVAEVFEVPLAFLLDPSNHQRRSMMKDGRPREYYAMPYQNYYIWGATAGILMNLYSILTA